MSTTTANVLISNRTTANQDFHKQILAGW